METKTILVCGITRSGLTATMQMLRAAGYPCFGTYPAFEDNHNQVYPGKACKLVDTNRCFPPTGDYHVILLWRDNVQQAKSIAKLLRTIGQPVNKQETKKMQNSIGPDFRNISDWAKRQRGFLLLGFHEIINDPLAAACKIKQFVAEPLDVGKMADMIISRSTDCYPTMLEFNMI